MTHNTAQDECPKCFKKIDRATNITGDGGPRPGDFSICLYCKEPLRYGERLVLRTISEEELEEFKTILREDSIANRLRR